MLIVVCTTIIIIGFFGVVARYYAAQPQTGCEECTVDNHPAEHEGSENLPRHLGSDNFEFLGDTISQWLLVIISAAGAVISAVAVTLVRDTLGVNRSALKVADTANKNARDVGFAQIRAYVSLVDLVGKTDPVNNTFTVSVGVQNSGQTPAHDISVRVWLVRTQEDGRDILTAGSRSFEDHSDLMPGEKRPIYAERVSFYNVINDPLQPNSLDAYHQGRTKYFLRGFLRYKTVGADWQRETAFNYRISGWHTLQPVDLVFTRESEGNRRT